MLSEGRSSKSLGLICLLGVIMYLIYLPLYLYSFIILYTILLQSPES